MVIIEKPNKSLISFGYSDKINSNKKGKEIVETTATTTLYANVLNLMGVKNPKTIDNSEKFLKLDLHSIDYKDLK